MRNAAKRFVYGLSLIHILEFFNVEKMYTDFLTGVSSLDEEELDFKNIQEDTRQVNWEEGTGKRTVSFEWKHRQFTLEAEVYDCLLYTSRCV